jgi:hypothetical protein
MPGRIEVRAVVGGESDPLHRRAFAVRKLLRLEAGEHHGEILGALLVVHVFDLRQHAWRIGGDTGLERN